MESIANIITAPKLKKAPKYKWQDEALEAIKFLTDGDKYKASIFKCFKVNNHKAKIALLDCKELNKPNSLYFLKIYNI